MPIQKLSLHFWGAAGTVTGSKTLVDFNEQKLLVDCGLFQGVKHLRRQNWEKLPVPAEDITTVVLTHAHLDHCGYLPRLVKDGFKGSIHCTPITAKLAEIILLDSAKIQEEDARRANQKNYSRHQTARPLYTSEDVQRCLQLFKTHEFGEWMVAGIDLRFSFHPNGHIPGSAMVELHAGSKKIVFSGDVGRLQPLIMRKPAALPPSDLLVLESTYGNRLHSVIPAAEQLSKAINAAVKRKGQILIPSFAVERSQEIIYLLVTLMRDKEIPHIPLFLDSPMAAAVTRVLHDYYTFLKDPSLRDILEKQLEVVSDYRASQAIVAMEGPKIVIAGSGMITGGRILHHLEAHLDNPKTLLILPGFQAVGTRGHSLLKGEAEIKFFGRFHRVKAEVVSLQGLSAHADREELVTWLQQAPKKPGRIVLNHGEEEAADSLRVKLEDEFNIPCRVSRPFMELVLDYEDATAL